jgi:hypothetical protein
MKYPAIDATREDFEALLGVLDIMSPTTIATITSWLEGKYEFGMPISSVADSIKRYPYPS